jgi:hypothetical protein
VISLCSRSLLPPPLTPPARHVHLLLLLLLLLPLPLLPELLPEEPL